MVGKFPVFLHVLIKQEVSVLRARFVLPFLLVKSSGSMYAVFKLSNWAGGGEGSELRVDVVSLI